MKLTGRQIPNFLDRPDPSIQVILIYGPDGGLVRERMRVLAKSVVKDLTDPFRLTELPANEITDDPRRLIDEVAALTFTGGRRVIMVRGAGDAQSGILRDCLNSLVGDALVLVEASNLGPRSSLRRLFEKAENGAAIPCYRDEAPQIKELIKTVLSEEGLLISGDALAYLSMNLGIDREISRRELEKLIVYMGEGGAVNLEDAEASVSASTTLELEDIAYATASGDLAPVDRHLSKALLEGGTPVGILRAVARHFLRLQQAAAVFAQGKTAGEAMESLKPAVFYRRRTMFQDQLQKWPLELIGKALEILSDSEIGCKRTGSPAESVCRTTLLRLALRPAKVNSSTPH